MHLPVIDKPYNTSQRQITEGQLWAISNLDFCYWFRKTKLTVCADQQTAGIAGSLPEWQHVKVKYKLWYY